MDAGFRAFGAGVQVGGRRASLLGQKDPAEARLGELSSASGKAFEEWLAKRPEAPPGPAGEGTARYGGLMLNASHLESWENKSDPTPALPAGKRYSLSPRVCRSDTRRWRGSPITIGYERTTHVSRSGAVRRRHAVA